MKCDRCDKPATVHLIEIKNGKKLERHLCEQHAAEEGITVKMSQAPINELLEKFVLKQAGAEPAAVTEPTCSECGLTFSRFRKTGLLGCPSCYAAFDEALGPLLERAQNGATQHLGKVPKLAGVDEQRQQELRRLRRQLEQAVAAEEYEAAARLRDQVRQLEASK